MKPEISIIVPIFNSANVLKRCVKSILEQSFTDFELILVNDGSTDQSLSICKQLADEDNRINVINKENGGVSSARNAGMKTAKGNYILFCDSDDEVSPRWCEVLHETIKENPDSWIVSNIYNANLKNGRIEKKSDGMLLSPVNYFEIYKRGLSAYCVNKIYNSEKIRLYNITFDESCSFSEDVQFNVNYCQKCSSIIYIQEPLYYYISNIDGTMNKYYPDLFQKHLMPYRVRLCLIQKEELPDYCDTWLYLFYRMFDNVFDSRNEMGLFEKFAFNDRMIKAEEFQHCLMHASGKSLSKKEIAVLKKRNYLLLYIFQKMVKLKQSIKNVLAK